MVSKHPLKVIIVGGGVAGLTLANMLEKFGLDYVLLEAHDDIAPPTGAGIGLMPNGSFILDQLGCYEAVREAAQGGEVEDSHIRDSSGKSVISLKHMMYHIEKRHGYPMLFFNRQWFLRVLYHQLKHHDRVHLNAKVARLDSQASGVQVWTEDGKSYTGSIAVGADGIHSIMRHEARRIAGAVDPQYFDAAEEDKVPCYYKCSFGIAQHVDGWPSSEQCFVAGQRKSFLVVSGPGGRVYWFLFVKLSTTKYGKDIPRYSREDEAQFVKENQSLKIRENLAFGQLYAKRLTSTLTPIHEIVYKKWFFGRVFLVGDSAHKPNPIGGMGANAAIETAAELVNSLLDLAAKRSNRLDDLSRDEVNTIFESTQAVRSERANFIVSASHELQAVLAQENPILGPLAIRVLLPLAGQHNIFRDLTDRVVGASRLRHLDLPTRPRALPYNHELPAGPVRGWSSRLVRGFSCCVLASLLFYTIKNPLHVWNGAHINGTATAHTSSSPEGQHSSFPFSIPDLESSPNLRLLFGRINLLSPLLIYTIEGYRIGRQGTILSRPILFTIMMQFWGIGGIASLYGLLSAAHVHQSPLDRPVPAAVARSLLPALFLSFLIFAVPFDAMTGFTLPWTTYVGNGVPMSLCFALLTAVLSNPAWPWHSNSDMKSDLHPEWYSTDDVPVLKLTYAFAFTVQTIVHMVTIASSLLAERVSDTSSPGLVLTVAAVASYHIAEVWQLRCQGYISTPKLLEATSAIVLGHLLVGSGATWASLWSWREDIMAGLSVRPHGSSSEQTGNVKSKE